MVRHFILGVPSKRVFLQQTSSIRNATHHHVTTRGAVGAEQHPESGREAGMGQHRRGDVPRKGIGEKQLEWPTS